MFKLHIDLFRGHKMASKSQPDPGVRALALSLGSISLWVLTTMVSYTLLRHYPHGVGIRALAVVIGLMGYIPWQVIVIWLIRHYDEYTRRLYLISFSIAFAATGLFINACNLLQRAGFIDYISLMTIWLVMIGSWAVALAGAQWYYCR
jgi:hypothetical protein